MAPLLLQCLYLLLFACASLFAYLFPETSEQLFYCLPWAERLQPMIGSPGEFRYRLMMWMAGSAAAPVFMATLVRCGLDVAPARQPRKLKELGWLFFGGASIMLTVCWLVFFVMIFAGPAWLQFEPLYALMLVGLFTCINASVHLLILKLRMVFA
jgi:hypothetical protein